MAVACELRFHATPEAFVATSVVRRGPAVPAGGSSCGKDGPPS